MDLDSVAAVLAGLALRLGVPLALTMGLIWLLRRLDAYWQAQGEGRRQVDLGVVDSAGLHCWDVRGCDPVLRATCPAFLNPDLPCWQHFRDREGNLRETCLACDLFRHVPARPVLAPSLRSSNLDSQAHPRRTDL